MVLSCYLRELPVYRHYTILSKAMCYVTVYRINKKHNKNVPCFCKLPTVWFHKQWKNGFCNGDMFCMCNNQVYTVLEMNVL